MMKKVEMLFPFLGWTLDNISYWIDIIEKKTLDNKYVF